MKKIKKSLKYVITILTIMCALMTLCFADAILPGPIIDSYKPMPAVPVKRIDIPQIVFLGIELVLLVITVIILLSLFSLKKTDIENKDKKIKKRRNISIGLIIVNIVVFLIDYLYI